MGGGDGDGMDEQQGGGMDAQGGMDTQGTGGAGQRGRMMGKMGNGRGMSPRGGKGMSPLGGRGMSPMGTGRGMSPMDRNGMMMRGGRGQLHPTDMAFDILQRDPQESRVGNFKIAVILVYLKNLTILLLFFTISLLFLLICLICYLIQQLQVGTPDEAWFRLIMPDTDNFMQNNPLLTQILLEDVRRFADFAFRGMPQNNMYGGMAAMPGATPGAYYANGQQMMGNGVNGAIGTQPIISPMVQQPLQPQIGGVVPPQPYMPGGVAPPLAVQPQMIVPNGNMMMSNGMMAK